MQKCIVKLPEIPKYECLQLTIDSLSETPMETKKELIDMCMESFGIDVNDLSGLGHDDVFERWGEIC